MAVSVSYNEIALYCPALVQPATPLSLSADPAAPLTFGEFSTGATTGTALKLNQNSRRAEIISQWGGAGAHGVFYGLDLSESSGLTLAYSAGGANVNGPQVKTAASTLALTANVYNYVWITSAAAITAVTSSARTSVPAAPTSACCFLGRVLCNASNIVEIDYSGRQYLRGGCLWRRTADEGEPTDTPGSATLFFNRTAGGVYAWDGVEYFAVSGDTSSLSTDIEDLQSQLDEQDYLLKALLREYFVTFGPQTADPILMDGFSRALAEG